MEWQNFLHDINRYEIHALKPITHSISIFKSIEINRVFSHSWAVQFEMENCEQFREKVLLRNTNQIYK